MRRNTQYTILSVITILSLFVTTVMFSSCDMQLDIVPSEEESEKTKQAEIEDTAEQTAEEIIEQVTKEEIVKETLSEDSSEDNKRMPEIDGTINKDEYKYSEIYKEMEVYWTNDKKNIYIGIKAKTKGYVSVAVQPGEKMKNADLILGFVKDNQTTIIDMFSNEDFGPHITDEKLGGENSIIEFSGSEENGSTSIEFIRLLDTEDKYDNILLKGDNQIIWAYSNLDDPESKHTNRGYGQIKID
jgi:hypothetical protein